MALSEKDQAVIDQYRKQFEDALAGNERFGSAERVDRQDGSLLATRFTIAADVWLEVAIRPAARQLQISLLTDDRWRSEEIEQGIQDSGDTMEELVELGFDDAGLRWEDPPVLHYREAGKLFYFSTPLDIESVADLADDAVRAKVRQMFEGYYCAFGPLVSAKS
ncbi:MAG: hypothetical protein ACYSUI_04795 [Planctomycetota bacterium]|jgi:hypothetical protein